MLHSTPFTALGISTVLIGVVTFSIAKGQPKIPPQASAILLQSGIENTSALVEEIGLKNKAIYLPTAITGDKPKALIPLDAQVELNKKPLPQRLIVKYGANPNNIGLLIITPGSAASKIIEAKPNASTDDIESAISQVLVDILNLADGANAVVNQKQIVVEVFKPRLEDEKMWIYESLGTPIASIVSSIVAQVLNKPVTIEKEIIDQSKQVIYLKIVEGKN